MKADKKKVVEDSGAELLAALNMLEEQQGIKKSVMIEAIKESLKIACAKHFGRNDNVVVEVDPDTCEYNVYREKTIVENVTDMDVEISLPDARMLSNSYQLGDTVREDVKTKEFCRIAAGQARQTITQKIREEAKKAIYEDVNQKVCELVTGEVQQFRGSTIYVNIGRVDALLNKNEQIEGEFYKVGDRIKVYILEAKEETKGTKVLVSRSHPNLVKRLFESEIAEVRDGIVEIKAISREAGSRTKIAVWSNDENVDPIGACVGEKSDRIKRIREELKFNKNSRREDKEDGEKIDVIRWDENPAILIENALSPAQVIFVMADEDEKTALVVVADNQLSLAIGKEGQNARLAAKLTGFKIDIKSESQARESGIFDELGIEDEFVGYGQYDEDVDDEYDEDAEFETDESEEAEAEVERR